MYSLRDQAAFAGHFVSNHLFDRPRLSVLMFYGTSACQSRCQTCYVWKKPVEHMSLELVRKALEAKCVTRRTRVGLEGGEFLLNPERDEILAHLRSTGLEFVLLSNGLLPERLAEAVERHEIPRVHISLDGPRETYERVRGLDGYDKVLRSIELIKDRTRVAVLYLINPWNDPADLQHVIEYCQREGVDLRVGVYHDMHFFDTTKDAKEMEFDLGSVDFEVFPDNRDFVRLFPDWRSGALRLPCLSIRQVLVIYPNGDVPICQTKNVVLGNLNERSLDEILGSAETIATQKRYRSCNDCWIGFHRKLELTLYRRLEFLPRPVLARLLGDYTLPPGR